MLPCYHILGAVFRNETDLTRKTKVQQKWPQSTGGRSMICSCSTGRLPEVDRGLSMVE